MVARILVWCQTYCDRFLSVILAIGTLGSSSYFILNIAELRSIEPVSENLLPAVGSEDQRNGEKVLALSANATGIDAQLWRGYGIELTESSMSVRVSSSDPTPAEHLGQTVANITGRAQSVSGDLRAHGISLVLVRPGEPGADIYRNQLVAALNTISDITYVSGHESGDFWRVDDSDDGIIRAHVGRTRQILPDDHEQIVVIPERFAPTWEAVVDNEALSPHQLSWQQAFTMPAHAHGNLQVSTSDTVHGLLTISQYSAMLIALIAALPRVRRRAQL